MALDKQDYSDYLALINDPDMVQVFGIIAACEDAQSRNLPDADFNTPETPPVLVPLKVVTYLISKYKWSITATNVGNMRRITKITLV